MIYGKRIRLRAITRDDLPKFVEWLNDPDVIYGLMVRIPFSLEEEQTWFEGLAKLPQAERPLVIEIQQAGEWRMIGNTSFHNISTVDHAAEFGIMVGDKTVWNQGYGSEAAKLMLQHGFENLNLHRIYLRVYENNPRAIRSYEKVGYVHEGRMRQAVYKNGKFEDVLLMSVLRSEWDAIKDK
jgi:RimJ/RimL family protein N-acetyltransferase